MAPSPPSVIRRGRNFSKQRDVTRAVRSARAAGLAVGGVEVVTKDGTTIRILSKDTAEQTSGDTISTTGCEEGKACASGLRALIR